MNITPKQKKVLDFIKSYVDENSYAPTQNEIKQHFNLKSFGSVQRYLKYLNESGHIVMDWNVRRGIRLPELNSPSADNNISSITQKSTTVKNEEIVDIPLLGKVAAGNPIDVIENQDTLQIPYSLFGGLKNLREIFALRVQGDSMIEDGIHDEDIIICKKQETANQGETVVAIIDGETTVKKFFKHAANIELRPANSTMSSIMVGPDNHFSIAGKLVGLIRPFM